MTTTTIVLFVIVGLVVLIALATAKGNKRNTTKSPIRAKAVLTLNEQPMYFRLVESLPEVIVLTQVAFSALLTTKLQGTRNKFNRKVCDFVICTKAFTVLAIVELDDASHNGREKEDATREVLLTEAGYKVLRYKRTPSVDTIQNDINGYENTVPLEKTEPNWQAKKFTETPL
ncbi:MAG: DUF2726 domain-containing protein [Glaciimonas sp.]|nr:DUF2726 domain-containing protein [Glaciimonas sp.]